MTNPNELVLKYLKRIKAWIFPDGSPHPDDLSEAEYWLQWNFWKPGK